MAWNWDRSMDMKSFIKNNLDRLEARYAEKFPDHCDKRGDVVSGWQSHYDSRVIENAGETMVDHYADSII